MSFGRFPRLYAAASLKHPRRADPRPHRPPGFPRLYAAASLKHRELPRRRDVAIRRFPRLYAAASLKQVQRGLPHVHERRFPRLYAAASLKHGWHLHDVHGPARFPRLYAAASLKLPPLGVLAQRRPGFSAALCRGLIEATQAPSSSRPIVWFSAALCRGLIEAAASTGGSSSASPGFPRLYAAASLKRGRRRRTPSGPRRGFSAALCRGLIEARTRSRRIRWRPAVFRGFMPRPH